MCHAEAGEEMEREKATASRTHDRENPATIVDPERNLERGLWSF